MILFRMAPRYLFLRTERVDDLANYLVEKLDGKVVSLDEGMQIANEYSSLVFLTGVNHVKTYIEDAIKIVLVNDGSSAILSSIINNHQSHLLRKVDAGPTAIIMRIPSSEDEILQRLVSIFDGQIVKLVEGVGIGEKDDTIIAFTNEELSGSVTDLKENHILIHQPARIVKDKLRLEGLRIITQSLDDSQWYELMINIYDSRGKYKEHYERLMLVLSALEVGMILGESWTKDYAVMLYSVMTYQVRLFTFTNPVEVKRILLSLEYTLEGQRLVDYDLYYKNKKISWVSVTSPKNKNPKIEIARQSRLDLYKKLGDKNVQALEKMEANIIEMTKSPRQT